MMSWGVSKDTKVKVFNSSLALEFLRVARTQKVTKTFLHQAPDSCKSCVGLIYPRLNQKYEN